MTLKNNDPHNLNNAGTLKSVRCRRSTRLALLFSTIAMPVAILMLTLFTNTGCRIYSFKDISIPDSIRTVKVNFIENKARYVNPQLSPRLSDKLRQKIVSQTRLSQTNTSENADWEISGEIRDYSFSTSAISGQRETGNRLTVSVHITVIDRKSDKGPREYDVSRNFEFSASQSIQQAEASLGDEMIRSLSDDIFNRIFSDW